jgi:hypothetical protein
MMPRAHAEKRATQGAGGAFEGRFSGILYTADDVAGDGFGMAPEPFCISFEEPIQ